MYLRRIPAISALNVEITNHTQLLIRSAESFLQKPGHSLPRRYSSRRERCNSPSRARISSNLRVAGDTTGITKIDAERENSLTDQRINRAMAAPIPSKSSMRRKWRDINRSPDALSTKLTTVFAVARRQRYRGGICFLRSSHLHCCRYGQRGDSR